MVSPSVHAAPRGRVATTGAAAGNATGTVLVLMRCSSPELGGQSADRRCLPPRPPRPRCSCDRSGPGTRRRARAAAGTGRRSRCRRRPGPGPRRPGPTPRPRSGWRGAGPRRRPVRPPRRVGRARPGPRGMSSARWMPTSRTSPPSWDFSSSEVPRAMTVPWSMTTIDSASASASSRYCVVRSTVVPPRTSCWMKSQSSIRVRRVEAGRRLVEDQHAGPAHEARAQVEPAPHAAGVGPDGAVGGVGEVQALQRLLGPHLRLLGAQAVQPSDHLQVLSAGQHLVDCGVLPGQADHGADGDGLADDVQAVDLRPAGIGAEQGGQHLDEGGLAGPVRAEEPEDGGGRHLQVHPIEGLGLAEGLADAGHLDHRVGHGRLAHLPVLPPGASR